MKAWTDRTPTSLFALRLLARLCIGALVLGTAACGADDGTGVPAPGTTNPQPKPKPLPEPTCTITSIDTSSTFEPTAWPDLAQFKLVAATDAAVFASAGTSLHRSLDEGQTWSLVDAPELRGASVYALASFGKEIFVSVQAQDGQGLFRSTDQGATWTSAAGGGCTMPSYLTSDGSALFASNGGATYEWDAAAATWIPLPIGEKGFDVIESDGTYLYGNSMYDMGGVFQLDLGAADATWAHVVDLPEWGYLAFAFDGAHGFAANATGLSETTDAGASWKLIDMTTPEVQDLLAVDGKVLAATDGGLRISSDGGATWSTIGDQPSISPFSLAASGTHVFAASDELRRASMDDLGKSGWQALHLGGDTIDMLYATSHAVLSVSQGKLFRSIDGGATWTEVTIEGAAASLNNVVVRRGSTTGDTVFAMRYSTDGAATIVASTDDGATFETRGTIPGESPWVSFLAVIDDDLVVGVSTGAGAYCTDVQDVTTKLLRSGDEGATWAEDMNGFPITFTDCYDESYTPAITGLCQAQDVLFAASLWKGSFRSVDAGKTWTAIETPEEIGAVSSVIETGDALVAIAGAGGIARSSDAGVTWKQSGLDGLAVATLARVDGLLLASVPSADPKDAGVYASSDGGVTWAHVDASFDARVSSVAVQGGHLFAGTLDESVWSVPIACH